MRLKAVASQWVFFVASSPINAAGYPDAAESGLVFQA